MTENSVLKISLHVKGFQIIQARSERSSEISKNCRKNSLLFTNARENESGRQILVRNVFLLYMRVEINRAGKFGTLCGKFWCKTFLIRYMSIMTFLDTEMAFCLWLPCSALRLNSKILNFSNNHFGQLTT